MKYIARISTSFTLADDEEYILSIGNEYDLPADNKHIQSLESQGLLFRVPGQAAEAKAENAPKAEKAATAEKAKPGPKAGAKKAADGKQTKSQTPNT